MGTVDLECFFARPFYSFNYFESKSEVLDLIKQNKNKNNCIKILLRDQCAFANLHFKSLIKAQFNSEPVISHDPSFLNERDIEKLEHFRIEGPTASIWCKIRILCATSLCPLQEVGILNQMINIHTKESITGVTYYSCHGALLESLSSCNLPPLFYFPILYLSPLSARVAGFSSFLWDKQTALSSLGEIQKWECMICPLCQNNNKTQKGFWLLVPQLKMSSWPCNKLHRSCDVFTYYSEVHRCHPHRSLLPWLSTHPKHPPYTSPHCHVLLV